MNTERLTGFKYFVNEKDTMKKNKAKYDKLIKELESINSKDNEDVKQAIAALKRGRDLKESPDAIVILNKMFSESPNPLLETLIKYVEV